MRTKHAPGRNFARILEKGESLVGATYFLSTFQTFFPLQHFFNLLPMVDVVRELWDRECSSGRQNASSHGGGPCSWCASEMRNLQSGSPEVKRPPIASCDVSHALSPIIVHQMRSHHAVDALTLFLNPSAVAASWRTISSAPLHDTIVAVANM
jgi:hypothetical protein